MPAATQEKPIIDEKELELQVNFPWTFYLACKYSRLSFAPANERRLYSQATFYWDVKVFFFMHNPSLVGTPIT